MLDLKNPAHKAAARQLVLSADVVLENNRPGVMDELGLGYDALSPLNPRLIYCGISGFGADGPYAQRPGFATLAEAMSGFAAINGEPEGAPLLPPIALTDELTAMSAAFATMTALHSGVGQVVDVNLLDTLLQTTAIDGASAAIGTNFVYGTVIPIVLRFDNVRARAW